MRGCDLVIFDDASSLGHVLLGLAASRLSGWATGALVLGFAVYQLREQEPPENKFGDFAEFYVGYLLGSVRGK